MGRPGISYFSQLCNAAALFSIDGRWRPLLSLLAILTCPVDFHHGSLHWRLIHPVLLVLVVEVRRLYLVLTIVSGQAALLSLQIERLDDSQLFIVEEDLVVVWTLVLVEFRHGACLEEFFGRSVAACAD